MQKSIYILILLMFILIYSSGEVLHVASHFDIASKWVYCAVIKTEHHHEKNSKVLTSLSKVIQLPLFINKSSVKMNIGVFLKTSSCLSSRGYNIFSSMIYDEAILELLCFNKHFKDLEAIFKFHIKFFWLLSRSTR